MHDGIATLDHIHDGVEVAEFASQGFFMRLRRRHFATVGEPQARGQRRQPAPQFAPQVTRGAGD